MSLPPKRSVINKKDGAVLLIKQGRYIYIPTKTYIQARKDYKEGKSIFGGMSLRNTNSDLKAIHKANISGKTENCCLVLLNRIVDYLSVKSKSVCAADDNSQVKSLS